MKWCGHHVGFVLAVGRIQPMLELFETGSILGVILVPLFTMQWIWTCQYIAQVSLAYCYSVGMTILRSTVWFPVLALSFLVDSKNVYETMIFWVYSCDYSLLRAPWSKLLALPDFIHINSKQKTMNNTRPNVTLFGFNNLTWRWSWAWRR